MITQTDYTQGRQAGFAMPTLRCPGGAWLRALPETIGGMSAPRTVAVKALLVGESSARTRFAADVHTVPGTRAWSPPI